MDRLMVGTGCYSLVRDRLVMVVVQMVLGNRIAADLAVLAVVGGGVSCSGLGLGKADSPPKVVDLVAGSLLVEFAHRMAVVVVVGRRTGDCESDTVAGSAAAVTWMIRGALRSLGGL